MKRLLTLGIVLFLALNLSAQVNCRHLTGDISKNDLSPVNGLKTANFTTSWFLRLTAAETAYEVPLFHGGGGQFFSATGLGVSFAAYNLNAVEKFSANALLFVDNQTKVLSSAAITVGVPIPKLNLPNINAGVRYDWNANIFYLQTSVTLEF
jgi:hypothetical protein